jgi:MYXO-CTERM domain-containing protein
VCNGQDDDCDAQTDEGGVCGSCIASPEVCDGCDNDCDGIVDNPPMGGFPTLPCGLPTPANCTGTMACEPPVAAPGGAGTCAAGSGYVNCSNNPQAEVCDGIDNNCNQQIDEGYVSIQCEPTSNPPNLMYGGNSQCTYGQTQCVGGGVVCVGGTGPSAEVCDGIDNDCNGLVDDNAFGVNQSCGINQPPCSPGMTACVNGALVCQGGTSPQPEVCDGIDNDCDANIDEAPLADAPTTPGCWNLPGNCCTHQNLSWCPPAGGTCDGNGTLTSPCNKGTLACIGGAWACNNPVSPQAEVCDGLDNDCNGTPDDGPLPGVNQACGQNAPTPTDGGMIGPCLEGLTQCVTPGVIDCVGDVGPNQESCNNVDDNCDGTTDNGIPSMGPCNVAYDMTAFPNSNPQQPPCQQGQLECVMGSFVCTGGKGPTAELCDGIDNDCDSQTDEAGMAPDGIDGSANPFPPPAVNIGDACGVSTGVCEPGNYACLNGLFVCLGGAGPIFEECDCEDNDCDGQVDEQPSQGEPPLCSPGKACVQASTHCQCAEPCSTSEYPCPPGQVCEVVQVSGGGMAQYCVTDFAALCGDCSVKTVTDGNMNVTCAPKGTDPQGCLNTPECVCRAQAGCQEPCFNVSCSQGKVCSNFGPKAGECVDDICYLTGCPGCDKACHNATCVNNPCMAGSCAPNEVCKPSTDFSTFTCVPSCADVTCGAAEHCVDGTCVPTCDPACALGKVCDDSTQTCVPNQCTDPTCPNGAHCDPLTGDCVDDPCSGVLCPIGQECIDGDCWEDGSVGGAGGGGSGGGGSGGGATTTTGAGGTTAPNQGVFGLPTGGGGCGCDLAPTRHSGRLAWLSLLAVGLVAARRRRRPGEVERRVQS